MMATSMFAYMHMYTCIRLLGSVVIYDKGLALWSERSGFDPHAVRRVVSLSKTNLLIKGTGNTQEAVESVPT